MYTFNDRIAPIIKYQTYNVDATFQDGDPPLNTTLSEYLIGINYFFNDWTRLQINYVITDDSEKDERNGFRKDYLVFQVQAKFN